MSSSPTVPRHLHNPAGDEINLNNHTTPSSPIQISLVSHNDSGIDVLTQPLDK